MKTVHYIFASLALALVLLWGCDPTEDLYKKLDELQDPYNEQIEYTITDADYGTVGGAVSSYKAFNDTAIAMDYVPAILARNFVALNLKSAAKVSYNFMIVDTVKAWENVVFGYTLTEEDYEAIGGWIATYNFFWDATGFNARDHLPEYLPTLYPDVTEDDSVAIIYNFNTEGSTVLPYADWYQFDTVELNWDYLRTITTVAEADEVLSEEVYTAMGIEDPYFPNTSVAESKILIWLKLTFPYADEGDTKIVQYDYNTSNGPTPKAVQFEYDGTEWIKLIGYKIEERSEQYVFSANGWVFDPTIRFTMDKDDYTYIAENDPIPHPRFSDQGYYYGASGYYRNFDMRLEFFHLRQYVWEPNEETSIIYTPEEDDPELVEIYNTQGEDAATEELFRRITQEALIMLLEHKFPDAQPQSEGVDVHFVVGFDTYNDDLSRSYLEAEYKCVTAGGDGVIAEFEFVDGPRVRE